MHWRHPVPAGLLAFDSAIPVVGVIREHVGSAVCRQKPRVGRRATLGSLVARVGRDSRWMATVGVDCGVAAAISTAFNAPIAGIVFAHEIILRHYSLRAFAPITVAATMGYVVANIVFERPPLFRVETITVSSASEFLGFILIGAAGACVAVLYMRAILFLNRIAGKLPVADYLKPMLAGAVLGLAAIWLPDILGIGKETLRVAVIDYAFAPGELALLLVAKILATALCIGFGFGGGVFSPALLIGILFGALAGRGAEMVLGGPRSGVSIYAICGMVAVTSAVIGVPLTTILIVLELTRNYDLAAAAMVSVVFSNLVSYQIFCRSLFDVQLRMRGFDLSGGRDKAMLDHRLIESYVTRDYTALAPEMPLDEAKSRLLAARRHEGYVSDAGGVYLGTVELEELVGCVDGDHSGSGAYEFGSWGVPGGRRDSKKSWSSSGSRRVHNRLRTRRSTSAYGSARQSSMTLVSSHAETGVDMRPHLPTSPAIFETAILKDTEWYGSLYNRIKARFRCVARRVTPLDPSSVSSHPPAVTSTAPVRPGRRTGQRACRQSG